MTRTLLTAAAAVFTAGPAAAQDATPDLSALTARMARLGKLPGELAKAKKADADVVEGLFLAALGRLPDAREKDTGARFLAGAAAGERAGRVRDFLWAVVNTKEFSQLYGLDKVPGGPQKLLNELIEKWDKEDVKK